MPKTAGGSMMGAMGAGAAVDPEPDAVTPLPPPVPPAVRSDITEPDAIVELDMPPLSTSACDVVCQEGLALGQEEKRLEKEPKCTGPLMAVD
jgi:hypothetical protein